MNINRSWRTFVIRAMQCALFTCSAWLVLPVGAQDQKSTPPVQPAVSTNTDEQVPIDLYKEPSPKSLDQLKCWLISNQDSEPCNLLRSGTEGWVELGFMVDPSGKPFEVTVVRSSGIKAFEDVAVKSIERSTFTPGTLDGKAVESGYEMKYVFWMPNPYTGAVPTGTTSAFAAAYKEVQRAVDVGDRAAADAAMKKLRVTNFYEDAYFGLATYFYADKWGDESQQLSGLQRAIAYEHSPRFLPKPLFESVLLGCLKLEMNLHQYAEALATAKTLQKNDLDKARAVQVASVIEQLQKLRSGSDTYEVAGSMPDGSWYLHLFKDHFQVEIAEGSVSQVKLRCARHYVSFAFDPKLQYTVSSKDGPCSIELVGAPGTQFKLVQF